MTEKNRKKDIETILAEIHTREEQGVVHEAVGVFVRHVAGGGHENLERIAGERLPEHIGRVFQEVFNAAQFGDDRESMKKFLESLQQAVGAMRVVTFDLAFEPSEEALRDMSSWIAENVGSDIVIEYSHIPEIIGGARIMFEGKYIEKTLVQKIDDVLTQERAKILKGISE